MLLHPDGGDAVVLRGLAALAWALLEHPITAEDLNDLLGAVPGSRDVEAVLSELDALDVVETCP